MQKYICTLCDWICPDCGAGVDMFEPLDEA